VIIKPRIRGFICVTSHPKGCQAHIDEQIAYVKKQGQVANGPKKVLVIGASTGYGLASRIACAFASGAATVGVFFERPSEGGKPATAGWYNSAAFEKRAHEAGLYARSINGDAYSDAIKEETIKLLKQEVGKVDLVVYSLASPRRTHPKTAHVYDSALKPIGKSFSAKSLNTDKDTVTEVSIEPAAGDDVANTIAVMGGEDWQMWMDALTKADLLADGAVTVAYSYIGPEVTWPIYRNGTIGQAKADVEKVAANIDKQLQAHGGHAYVSVNKAVVTQASSAIPVVPLYISLLFKVMKEKGTHEGCIEQMYRLIAKQLYNNNKPQLDENKRIRLDDWEMDKDVQAKVGELWKQVTTENLKSISDYEGYKKEFLKLFGFELSGVDYEADVDPEVAFEKVPIALR
jgi:enoyl-[acyl-carrier protein] reductase/trans-2-enoyl-CoA reductase (NAD+)